MDLLLLMVLASAPATLGLALIAGPLAATFLPAQYIEPVRIVIPIAAAAGFSGGLKYFVFDQACHMAQRTGVNLGVTLPAILVGTILMLVLIPAYGVAGCALGLLGQFVVALLASYIVARRMLPFTLPWRDLARIGLMTTAMGIAVQLILLGARGSPPSIQLLLAVVVGIAVYVVAAVALKPKPVRDILRFTFGNRKLKEL